ncbi:hypothetical protein EIP86_000689 [Pleurotus ostreatoroseus]|nr:hypothetical protein EIP86_000689 [Pleurotus ostreatoroseus]
MRKLKSLPPAASALRCGAGVPPCPRPTWSDSAYPGSRFFALPPSSSPSPSSTPPRTTPPAPSATPNTTMVRPLRLSQPLRARRLPQAPRPRARFASSGPEGSSEAAKKAQDAVATAQKYAGEAVEKGKQMLGPIGERLAGLLGGYRQPIVYNFSVAREFLKQVYVAERLQPPSWNTVTNAYNTIFARARNPAYWRELVNSGEWTKVGIYAVEAYGVFKIGEIIGRRSLVGYNVQ